MKKLTAEKCCQLLDTLNSNGMSILEGYYAEALEIALPILEQQEQKQKVSVREGLAALSAHIDSIGGYNFEALEAYRREEFGQQERDVYCPTGYRVVPEKLTNEMLRRIVPNMAHSLPISHDEYDYHGRNERFIKWIWARLLELSEAAIPEQSTNQNGEQ